MESATHSNLEKLIGYRFVDRALLRRALTPPSAGMPEDNQRLEFLGDSVLHLCASRLVYGCHEDWQEGPLSRLRSKIVSTDSLHRWALDLGLVLTQGPRSTKKKPQPTRNELADAVEALLAAVVLDSDADGGDGVAVAGKIIQARFANTVATATLDDWVYDDPKTALQEKAALLGTEIPVYALQGRAGPDHAPLFTCSVQLGGLEASATGTTLKRAQSAAAGILLGMLPAAPGPKK